MKSPRGRPSFSRPQCLELFESGGANGSELSILEGSAAGAAAGGPGRSSLATSAPNRGHPGSLPPAANGEHRNPKVGKDKGKGDQVKAESLQRKELPASQATTGPKAALPQGKRAETNTEAGLKTRGALARHMREAVQVFHALGKKQDVAAAARTLQAIPETQEHLAAPAGASAMAPVALQEKEAPLTHKRKRGPPEPTPEVWKKLRTFLSANMPAAPKHKERMAGSFGVPRPPPKVREHGGSPAEGSARRRTRAGLWAAARDGARKADHRPARPIPPRPDGWRAGAFRPPAPRGEWRAEREHLKRKAQRERELAARYTALGRRNFFEERQKDMEIARYYGYAV